MHGAERRVHLVHHKSFLKCCSFLLPLHDLNETKVILTHSEPMLSA